MNKYALISVSDKTGLIDFAKELIKLNFQIISTGGTYKTLKENHLEAIPIEEITEFPEMLDGRVKTLNPKIFGGILAIRQNKVHMNTCEKFDLKMIDLVVVNLYPFEKVIQNEKVHLEEAIENIDIGGPSLIRAAAKNYDSVAVITDPAIYSEVIEEMKKDKGRLSLNTKKKLALNAFKHTARYDAIISNFLDQRFGNTKETEFPTAFAPVYEKVQDLRYGENPHQQAAFYKEKATKVGLPTIEKLHGKELSYNNLMDLESAWNIAKEFDLPVAVIIKHTNPCGVAVSDDIFSAYLKAYESDPVSAFGSIIALNRTVTKKLAEELNKLFVEVVIAPGYEETAIKLLTQKIGIRIIKTPDFCYEDPKYQYRFLKGGLLMQSSNTTKLIEKDLKVVTEKAPSKKQINDMIFAQTIVKHVKSNAIVIVKDGQTLGVGAGQMSRIDSVNIALEKAGEKAKGAVAASDAFFPFSDSIDAFGKAGIASVIQPGGSKRDQESIDKANELDISMVFTDVRFFYH